MTYCRDDAEPLGSEYGSEKQEGSRPFGSKLLYSTALCICYHGRHVRPGPTTVYAVFSSRGIGDCLPDVVTHFGQMLDFAFGTTIINQYPPGSAAKSHLGRDRRGKFRRSPGFDGTVG